MLKTDKPIYKLIIALNLLLLVAGLVSSVLNIVQAAGNIVRILMNALFIATMIFGIVYIAYGYTKNAAQYFLCYGYALAASVAGTAMNTFSNRLAFILLPLFLLMLAAVVVLVVKPDLGRKKSFTLCGILIALALAALITSFFGYARHIIGAAAVLLYLACLFGVMIYAKYLDKAARGTK